jgi:N-acetylmuramoyl-L-alanine amidase
MLKFVKALILATIFCGFGGFKSFQDPNNRWTDDPTVSVKTRLKTVVLDAGHGGKDPGCHGVNHNESKIALKIVLSLGQKISDEFPDVKVIYTRKKDVYPTLDERSALANRNKADLFMSIHCNSHPSSKFAGTETYTMGLHKSNDNLNVAKRENSVILQEKDYQKTYNGFNPNSPLAHIMMANYQNAFMMNSIKFAQKVERQFKKKSNRTSYGVKQAGFLVLWETAMPSVLIETGFLTNEAEEKYLASEEGKEEVALAIFKAFKQYKEEIEN